ncbi:IclR family transcriptional regulator [Achromobacter aloeverae]|uniref:IclR family transcriptional regulator n=1 Tax=Achromobacter aloeverae TaxID=1750518 RepID=A0A4Q1HHN7_9BURK|nr:IclR family transcriptional regulator [Achromobacter aloeverae]RXN85326.1 IclR family transcriptional regulator [Achromobacter aloeverae]
MSILDSATDVLRLLARSGRDLTVTDVVNGLDVPKSSASRVLKQMMECGLLERDVRTLAYRPSLLMLELSHQVRASSSTLDRMEEALQSLVQETGHTGYISVLDETGRHVVVLRVRHGSHPLRVVTWPGHRSLAVAVSTGRTLLARLPDDALARVYGKDYPSVPDRAPASLPALLERLEQVRRDGWSIAIDEALPGVGSISCSVADPDSGETLAFCLSFPSPQEDPDFVAALTQRLVGHARAIGRAARDEFWTARS